MQGLGYKEILAYLDGEYPLEEAVRILKRDTRHFAKRQLTWFRREKDTIWMNKDEFDYNEDRILDEMLEKGLLEEVQKLKSMGYHRGMVSMQGLGYKEILAYLDGEYPLEEAVRILKRDTRHFAKRQLTWFRREKDTIWMNKDEFDYNEDLILEKMLEICREREIL